MGLYNIFFRPDLEEDSEKAEIAEAANLLQVGEFQLLQLAYYDWFGRELHEEECDRLFAEYMLAQKVPFWARHYARSIVDQVRANQIDPDHAGFHRYDRDYVTHVPDGVRRFWVTAFFCGVVVFGGVAVANMVAEEPVSRLPPYFERSEID